MSVLETGEQTQKAGQEICLDSDRECGSVC